MGLLTDLLGDGNATSTVASTAWATVQAVESGARDVNILLVGDSTGDETTEWFYLLGEWLATQHPTHSVDYKPRLATAGTWGTTVEISNGSGSRTINLWNASKGGWSVNDFLGEIDAILGATVSWDCVMVSLGHNGGLVSELTFRGSYVALVETIAARQPGAGVILHAQNSSTDNTYQGARRNAILRYAQRRGFSVVDAWAAFGGNTPDPALLADTQHPNAAGSAVWRDLTAPLFDTVTITPGAQMAPALLTPGVSVIPVTAIPLDVSAGAVTGWANAGTQLTITAETTIKETGAHSAKLEVVGTADAYLQYSVGNDAFYNGKAVTFAVRMRLPSASSPALSANSGVLQVYDGATFYSEGFTLGPLDVWFWRLITVQLPASVTDLRFQIYPDKNEAAGKHILVDRAVIVVGDLPADHSLA